MARGFRALTLILAVALAAACTVKETKVPPMSGPSELGLSLVVSANPDTLTQNGSSQAQIVVQALDSSGQPVRNLTVRFDVAVNGAIVDYGTLSSKSAVTAADGRASVIYTAPAVSPVSDSPGGTISVLATPVGTNYANAATRAVDIRLVPPGVIVPPSDLKAGFQFAPDKPVVMTDVVFTARACAGSITDDCSAGSIAGYSWNFGDGRQGSGLAVSHQFREIGSYPVTLTVFDELGRAVSTTKTVTVAAGTGPSAGFVFSPTSPLVDQVVFFNASSTTYDPTRVIVSYEWDFGDGATARGLTASHAYSRAGAYQATLLVTDDAGRKSSTSKAVTVAAPLPTGSVGEGVR